MQEHQLTPLGRRLIDAAHLAQFRTRFATARSEREAALRLVHDNYVSAGLCSDGTTDIIYYRPLGLAASRMAIVQDPAGRMVGTLSIVEDNALGLKLDHTYRSEVAELRSRRRRLAELTCLAIRHQSLREATAVFFTLTRFLFRYASWRGLDDLLMAIHPRHFAFYRRFFHVIQFGPRRSYDDVQGQPAIACRVDLHTVTHDVAPQIRRYYWSERYGDEDFAAAPMPQEDHLYFCRRAGLSLYDVNSNEARSA